MNFVLRLKLEEREALLIQVEESCQCFYDRIQLRQSKNQVVEPSAFVDYRAMCEPANNGGAIPAANSPQQVIIMRVEYADGTFWTR